MSTTPQIQDPWKAVSITPNDPAEMLKAEPTPAPSTSTQPTAAAQPNPSSDPWKAVSITPNEPGEVFRDPSTAQVPQQQQEQGLGSKVAQGVKESMLGQIPGQAAQIWHGATDAPRDSREHAVLSIGGQPALMAYRAGKEVVNQAEQTFKSKPEEFAENAKMLQKAVQDFHSRDYRNMASDLASYTLGGPTLDPAQALVGQRGVELSEGARSGGNLVTPLTKDALDVGTLALDSDFAKENIAKAGKAISELPSDVRSSLEDAVHYNADEAAQKALKPNKRQAIRAQQDLAGARPYFEGAETLEQAQAMVKPAKAEIWAPYEQAINGPAGNVEVMGPDGPAKVRDLEAERLKTRAELDAWQQLKPADRQVQLQKGQKIQELNDRYNDLVNAIDPELYKVGIDPKLIRKTFGQVQGVNRLLEGRNTLSEAAQKYGFSKIFNFDVTHPLKNLTNIKEGAQDILAGRPKFSGKPTDVNVKEGFRPGTGGEKPNLTPGIPPAEQGEAAPPPLAGQPSTPNTPSETPAAAPEPITYRTDNNGIRWAKSADSPAEVSVPKNLEGDAADAYARGKIDLQKEFAASRKAPEVKTEPKPAPKVEVKAEPKPEPKAAKPKRQAAGGLGVLAGNANAAERESEGAGDNWSVVNQTPEVSAAKAETEPADIPSLLDKAAREHDVPPEILHAQARQESGLNPDAVSPKGATGVMQLMPATADQLGVDPEDPAENINGGAQYLKQMRERFGSYDKALAAYNAGPERVQKSIELYHDQWLEHMPKETRDYVHKILRQAAK